MPDSCPLIKVSCAVIVSDQLVFAAKRARHKSMPQLWEFPGGKIEDNESVESSIVREMREELALDVIAKTVCPSFFHDYGDFKIELIPVVCSLKQFQYELKDHEDVGWFDRDTANTLDWCPADIPIVEYVFNLIKEEL